MSELTGTQENDPVEAIQAEDFSTELAADKEGARR